MQYELIEKGTGGKTPEVDEDSIKTHHKDGKCVCLSCYHTQRGEEQSQKQARENHRPTMTGASVHVPHLLCPDSW